MRLLAIHNVVFENPRKSYAGNPISRQSKIQ
jgi:hypothetical protein